MTFRVGVCKGEGEKHSKINGHRGRGKGLTPVLTPGVSTNKAEGGGMIGQMLLHLVNGGGGAGGVDMIINAEDHLFISMAKPGHGLLERHASVHQHGAVSMTEIMAADGDRMNGGSGKGGNDREKRIQTEQNGSDYLFGNIPSTRNRFCRR